MRLAAGSHVRVFCTDVIGLTYDVHKITLAAAQRTRVTGKMRSREASQEPTGVDQARRTAAWTWEAAVQMVRRVRLEIYFGGSAT